MDLLSLILGIAFLAIAGLLISRGLQSSPAGGDISEREKGRANAARNPQRPHRRSSDDDDDDDGDDDDSTRQDRSSGARAGSIRHRRQQQRTTGGHGDVAVPDSEEELHGPLNRLQKKRLAKERERAARRQANDAAVEQQQQTAAAAEQHELQSALKEMERKAAEEAALAQLREAKRRADDEEYAKWAGEIGVEERGELGEEAREKQAATFQYLRRRSAAVSLRAAQGGNGSASGGKVIGEGLDEDSRPVGAADGGVAGEGVGNVMVLQTVARSLLITVEELVNAIQQLENDGEMDGVFDDRGRYVLIAPSQFPLLAQFIRHRGRVSLPELTRECNRIIMQA